MTTLQRLQRRVPRSYVAQTGGGCEALVPETVAMNEGRPEPASDDGVDRLGWMVTDDVDAAVANEDERARWLLGIYRFPYDVDPSVGTTDDYERDAASPLVAFPGLTAEEVADKIAQSRAGALPELVAIVGTEFQRVLARWLSVEEREAIDAANRAEDDRWVCHSHDHCDANEAMCEALRSVLWRDEDGIDTNNAQINGLWNRAWEWAKTRGFSDRKG